MQRRALSLVFCLAANAFAAASARAQLADTSPQSLLRQMERTYATAQSYSDDSTANYRNPDGSPRSTVAFKIWFARPNLFRVDALTSRPEGDVPRREVMWTDGEKARAWSLGMPVVNMDKIQIAGSRMFGTYAYHVPTLLEASYGGRKRLHELGSPLLAGEEPVEGVDCYRIRGEFHGDPYEIWLGKSDYLLRKVVATYAGNKMEETHRNVTLNKPIPAAVFNFAPENEAVPPPAEKQAPSATKKPTR